LCNELMNLEQRLYNATSIPWCGGAFECGISKDSMTKPTIFPSFWLYKQTRTGNVRVNLVSVLLYLEKASRNDLGRSDHFRFGSVFTSKKQPNRKKKRGTQTEPEPIQTDRFRFGF